MLLFSVSFAWKKNLRITAAAVISFKSNYTGLGCLLRTVQCQIDSVQFIKHLSVWNSDFHQWHYHFILHLYYYYFFAISAASRNTFFVTELVIVQKQKVILVPRLLTSSITNKSKPSFTHLLPFLFVSLSEFRTQMSVLCYLNWSSGYQILLRHGLETAYN